MMGNFKINVEIWLGISIIFIIDFDWNESGAKMMKKGLKLRGCIGHTYEYINSKLCIVMELEFYKIPLKTSKI